MRKLIAISLLVLPLTACNDGFSEMDWRYLPGAGAGGSGGSVPAPAQPAPGSQAPGTGAAKMLQDPEAESGTDSDYVWASSPEQAQQMCDLMAANRGNRLDDVRPASNWTNNAGKQRYVCYMTVFGR